jgi:hypothetical protein
MKESSCPICGINIEKNTHILWSCPPAMNVWGAYRKKFHKSYCSGSDFLQVLDEMSNKCTIEELNYLW